MDDKMKESIQLAQECKQVCLDTLAYCKSKGGDHASPEHLMMLEDCARICDTSVDFMERGSENHSQVCALCAEICDRCADSCDMMTDDEQMKKCAEVCRACAEACRNMSS